MTLEAINSEIKALQDKRAALLSNHSKGDYSVELGEKGVTVLECPFNVPAINNFDTREQAEDTCWRVKLLLELSRLAFAMGCDGRGKHVVTSYRHGEGFTVSERPLIEPWDGSVWPGFDTKEQLEVAVSHLKEMGGWE